MNDGGEYGYRVEVEWLARLSLQPKQEGVVPKAERSIAVALLLDMSASAGEPIESTPARAGRRAKRIIDLEKEALVVLVYALQALKHSFGIYGFSGYGRNNVEFYAIKGLRQPFSPNVARRIDAIAPLFATRLGPAIRHAAAKLLQDPARSRFLFVRSDGRPQDRGYSSEGEGKQYAVQDSRMALLEARRQGIEAFCLTVDGAGRDYMKTMMHGMGYEVLTDIGCLPERLPQLYRRLTA